MKDGFVLLVVIATLTIAVLVLFCSIAYAHVLEASDLLPQTMRKTGICRLRVQHNEIRINFYIYSVGLLEERSLAAHVHYSNTTSWSV